MGLELEIPDTVLEAMRLPPGDRAAQLRRELAVALYEREILSFGAARELAVMDVYAFGRLLGERAVPRHYTDRDLRDDLDYARGE
jgi:predicted HTH domain antitoxin